MTTKKLSKKHDSLRKWRSFKKHAGIIFHPLVLSILITYLWWVFVFNRDIHFSKDDETPLLAGVILMLSVAYTITTAATFASVWEKYQKVVLSVLRRDQGTFLCYRDERIPIVIHLLILSFSVPLLGIIVLLQYKTAAAGATAVGTISFVLALYWIVVTQLQDPSRSLWFAERIPQKWLEIDIDEHFRLADESARSENLS